MTLRVALIALAAGVFVALSVACALRPSWPLVGVLAVLVLAALGVLAGILWAERDTRLDVKGRQDAARAAAVIDEAFIRIKSLEERVGLLTMQKHMNGFTDTAFDAIRRGAGPR